jgi:hypothetical protein
MVVKKGKPSCEHVETVKQQGTWTVEGTVVSGPTLCDKEKASLPEDHWRNRDLSF